MKKQNLILSVHAYFGITILAAVFLLTANCLLPTFSFSQNIGINATGALPNASAGLDVDFADKGLLIPRVGLTSTTDVATIASPASSLLVYNTNAAMTGGAVGYWYWDGSQWAQLGAGGGGSGWLLLGNTGTTSGTNFVGTTDNQAFDIRTNNILRTKITTKGQIEVYNTGRSVFIGEGAGTNDDLTNNYNVFMGYQAGLSNTTGQWNIANGYQALYSNTTANWNTAIGYQALYSNTLGFNNTAIGYQALYSNIISGNNTAMGTTALWANTGDRNTAIGTATLTFNNSGSRNTAIGHMALYNNIAGSENTAIGLEAGRATTGSGNVFLGFEAGKNETGSNKLYIANSSTTWPLIYGDFSTARVGIGTNPLVTLHVATNDAVTNTVTDILQLNHYSSGVPTASFGTGVLFTGMSSTTDAREMSRIQSIWTNAIDASRASALQFQTLTAAGVLTTKMTISDVGNVILNTTPGTVPTSGIVMNTVDGADNQVLTLSGGGAISDPARGAYLNLVGNEVGLIPGMAFLASGGIGDIGFATNSLRRMTILNGGNVGIGTTTPGFKLEVNGTTACTGNVWTSDLRKKKNIQPLYLNGLEIISKLNPIMFEWKEVLDEGMNGMQMGFIAQELEKVLPTMVLTVNDSIKSKVVKYNELLPILVEAIKELTYRNTKLVEYVEGQQNMIDSLQAENGNFKTQNESMNIRINKLEQILNVEVKK